MIATGTDVKPLECVFFMRSVKSRTYFEQMKGRGVRIIDDTDFQAVTPDATAKDRFVIVDAVGVTETELVDTVAARPQADRPAREAAASRSPSASATPTRVSTIAGRLARLDRRLGEGRPRRARDSSPAARACKEIARRDRRRARPRPPARSRPRGDRQRRADRRRDRRRRPQRCSTRPSRRSRPTRSCASGSSTCAAPTSRRSTRPPPTR